jgi:hypothetical protein
MRSCCPAANVSVMTMILSKAAHKTSILASSVGSSVISPSDMVPRENRGWVVGSSALATWMVGGSSVLAMWMVGGSGYQIVIVLHRPVVGTCLRWVRRIMSYFLVAEYKLCLHVL